MSVCIRIKDAVKKYGDNTIISDLSLNIKEGEFFTLLGPSGCGKTTLLRMIAGFNSIEGGDFYFNDKRINDIDPSKRNIGMVFQNYAIFPHMTVRDNVAFGLKNRKESKETIQKETDEFMKLMHISEYADRMPDQLSGGQQQRVALARAQEEAMAVADRIAVINKGDIQQVGTPKDIYQRPANLFVATFIGRSNVLDGELRMENGKPVLHFHAGASITLDNVRAEECKNQPVKISVRPEEFILDASTDATGLKATVDSSVFLGLNTHYFAHTDDGDKIEIIQESQIDSIIPDGTVVRRQYHEKDQKAGHVDGFVLCDPAVLCGVSAVPHAQPAAPVRGDHRRRFHAGVFPEVLWQILLPDHPVELLQGVHRCHHHHADHRRAAGISVQYV